MSEKSKNTPPAGQQAAPKAAPVRACVCGETQASGTVHRVDGPCYVAAPQQEAQEPALFVSAKQLADLVDPSHATGGSYLPARKTRAGLFTQPLYTAPHPPPERSIMTNPTPHGQVPEVLIDLIDAYAEARHRCGGIYNPKTEAARKAVIEALSGVKALSAAPAEQEEAAQRLRKTLDIDPGDVNDPLHPRYIAGFKSGHAAGRRRAAPAASPTPPAEQQAAPKAAPGERLTREQIREVFMANGFTVKEGQTDLKQYVYDAAHALLELVAAPQQEAQEPCPTCVALARAVMLDQVSFDRKPDCYGIRQITNDEGVEEWEDIRTSPDVAREEANDMMATGRGELYEVVPLWTTPQPAPAPPSEREAFERDWEKRHAPVPINGRTHDDGRYGDLSIQDAWESWQARAALAAQGGK